MSQPRRWTLINVWTKSESLHLIIFIYQATMTRGDVQTFSRRRRSPSLLVIMIYRIFLRYSQGRKARCSSWDRNFKKYYFQSQDFNKSHNLNNFFNNKFSIFDNNMLFLPFTLKCSSKDLFKTRGIIHCFFPNIPFWLLIRSKRTDKLYFSA